MARLKIAAIRWLTFAATAGVTTTQMGCGGGSSDNGSSSLLQTITIISLMDRLRV